MRDHFPKRNKRLERAIRRKKLRKLDIAYILEMHPSQFSLIVSGVVLPKPEQIEAISRVLGMPPEEIF